MIKFETCAKDRYYFDKYEFRFSFYMSECSALRKLDHSYIDWCLNLRASRVRPPSRNYGGSWRPVYPEINETTRQMCHDLCDRLLNLNDDFKLVISSNNGWIYTNSVHDLATLDQLLYLRKKEYRQVVLDRPKNTIKLKTSQYSHRSYFRRQLIGSRVRHNLTVFLQNQTDIRISPALTTFADQQFSRLLQEHYFIDHNDQGILLMLGLIVDNPIRKTIDIIADK
jgi:hypothetical protein